MNIFKNSKFGMLKSRIQSIDLIKIIAMICVMGLHCAGAFVSRDNENICGNIVGRASVCAIPLFFMVSGYLLLGKTNSDWKYSLKKIIAIIRFVAICTIGYTLLFWLYCIVNNTPLNYLDLVKNFIGAFIQRGPFSIFWYFGAMIIIYIIYPLINRIFNTDFKYFVGILLVLLLFESIIYTQHTTHNMLNIKILSQGGVFESSLPQTFRIWNWLFYFMLGGVLKIKKVINYIKSYFTIWTIILLGVLNVGLQMILLPALDKIQCEYFYCSFFVIAYSSSIFIYAGSKQISNSKLIAEMSRFFLPVYAFHMFVIKFLSRFTEVWDAIGFIAPFIFWIFVSAITITISYFIMKIPLAKKIFKI